MSGEDFKTIFQTIFGVCLSNRKKRIRKMSTRYDDKVNFAFLV